jgi:urea carboxylase-associated protein 1
MSISLQDDARTELTARLAVDVPAGEGFAGELHRGETLRIVDLHGNQAVDTLFFDAHDYSNRYSAVDTLREQGSVYLELGSRLLALDGGALVTIVGDTCGRHDTLGGACSRESNTMRYALDKEYMHACRDSFIRGAQECGCGLGKRDLTCNINFFMNVPVTPDGRLTFEDGVSAGGKYVELRAERDVIGLISNCPQLNNPCNAYNPTPVEVMIWEEPAPK